MTTDWDDAYANAAYIDGAESYPPRWARDATHFRNSHPPRTIPYGPHPREMLDLFHPGTASRGLMVFVHGGYWKAFDKDSWSHLATGALANGYAVAIPSYVLAPEAHIHEITRQIGSAITRAAGETDGPILLTGHSAGGHLVARMGCADAPLAPAVAARITRITPISGLVDLRPLLKTNMRSELRLDDAEARTESPALLDPRKGFSLTAWVGAAERPEFLRQNSLLSNIWTGMGVDADTVIAPGKHHFNVIDDLADASSALCRAVLGT